ncbi:MAG: hypothetical protein V2I40_02615, partial [Desulfobacteraceae bacterium]|nr:hypothetical protein [Desulfobacteraceae bacterium]
MAATDHPEVTSRDTSADLIEKEAAAINHDMETNPGTKPFGAAPADSEKSGDDELDDDQQRAFEHILAQIESDGLADAGSVKETGDVPESHPAVDLPAGLEKVENEVDANDDARPDGTQHVELSDDESHPCSNDIEDILTAIAAGDDAAPVPEAASDDAGAQQAAVEASDREMVDDDIVAHQQADHVPEPDVPPQTATASEHAREAPEADERPRAKGPSVEPRSSIEPIPVRLNDRQHPEPLRETGKPAVGRQKKAVLASMIVVLLLALTGYVYRTTQTMRASTPVAPHADTGGRDAAVEVQSTLQGQKPAAVAHGPSDQSRLNTAAENMDRLRSQIIEKQTEIGKLRAYYQAGINAEIQGIAHKVGNAGNGKMPFESAIADPSISMGLSAIQRRDTYIKKLETPLSILVKSSEALLYFSRKAALLALMVGKTSGIDIDGFLKQTDEITTMHGSELARLNIDAVPAAPRTLASIWQDIEAHMSRTAATSGDEARVTDPDNAAIWKNICDGDFSQKHRLTRLSLEAARCLTAWKGKDLFLNALTDLSPDAARLLTAWEGDWLGLN